MVSNQGNFKSDLVVYVAILALACVQVFFLKGHLFALLSVAIVQAILAVMFFMHLGSEKPTLRLALIPGTLFVLVMLNMIWADSYRLMSMKPFAK
ncbi:MAG TPA: cytochrome C oxidase subunit IV family protein [Candidatus Acidoferrum sp.]|jgi:cytochrome c oxidase subunit IV|nr:cytochrome C oxidase subunit IV family protein [Candidatus Acidoferrum sp.]